ncbi:MAG: hypothetical protein N2517_07410 [Ignavibacteria bacterium]|nr:hypothetical protein [Ignavibacteria bacterium]
MLWAKQDKPQSSPMPGPLKIETTPEQDSYFRNAKKVDVSPEARFYFDMKVTEPQVLLQKKLQGISQEEILRKNLQIPVEMYLPLPQEIVLYQYGLIRSQSIPFIQTYKPFGLQVPLASIVSFFGLIEDVSPKLQYTLDFDTEVRIVIYSEQALIVAKIFEGHQKSGTYSFIWDGKDDLGRPLPRGDYIGEIFIKNSKVIRKRIRLER